MILLITTCGSRGGGYLARLRQQIDASGWRGRRVLVCDGPSIVNGAGWTIADTAIQEGQKPTYWRALAIGLEEARRTGDDRILILEDDVELCTNALSYMERARVPHTLDFVTWYDGHIVPPGAAAGIYPANGQYFICLQGVTWPLATAERLLSSPIAAAWPEPHGGDILIARILRGRPYGVHVPNLVQHLGAESVVTPGATLVGARTATNYPGRAFDAETVGRRGAGQRPGASGAV
jgi:hypothetical protein